MNQVDLFLAPGFEEIELVTVVDILRRADISTRLISIHSALAVTGAHQITIQADLSMDKADHHAQMLVLPGGGPGTQAMLACTDLHTRLQQHLAQGKPLAAICAAPMVLAKAGLLKGINAICYPGCEAALTEAGANIVMRDVVKDGLITTSRGPGTAAVFAFELVRQLKGEAISQQLSKEMLFA
ncbi:DJ-1/PfpI family protein [Iodobacter sp. HSC-16F04]|uniref:DJ-1/PfpI family protein n=1 Tax=Iodobacter violaceini TaxID=3044271 RepID=A0ABX0KU30_9NEIS|nr:DJ-1 family glyoxalase III [Iodobacter violacea]NHQ88166.1 DJ-1/PfpI family protein [Iodobacter violacea]